MKKHYGGTLISQIKQLQDRVFNKILKEEGIYEFNGQQGRILFSLWKDEKLSLIELSKRTSLAKTTLSSMVERMKNDDLLIVEESKEDKRSLIIYLSNKTLSLESKINRATKRMGDIFYKGLSEEEASELDRLLNKVKENLKMNKNIVIRQIQVKEVMTKSNAPIGGYCVNPYVGCTHGCKYCYASFMKRFTGHTEEWGTFLDVKNWQPIKNLDKFKGEHIIIGTVTDGYLPEEAKYNNTRKLLEQLVGVDAELLICTKSDLVVRDLDLLKKFDKVINVKLKSPLC